LTQQAAKKLKKSAQPTLYAHHTFGLIINMLAILSSKPFNAIPREAYYGFFLISLFVTYRFFYNFKSYELFDFEELYGQLRCKPRKNELKIQDPYRYYFSILRFMSEKFPGVHFEYKLRKRIGEDQITRDKSCKEILVKMFKKIGKNLKRSFCGCFGPTPGQVFVETPEITHHKLLKCEFWQLNEVFGIYFTYLNLPLMIILFFGDYQAIILDVALIFLSAKLADLARAQSQGDMLLKEALRKIEREGDLKLQQKRVRNGEVVKRYLELKTKQYQDSLKRNSISGER
jgi:hypothetical protein